MNINTKETYSEVYEILNLLGNDYITKLPKSLYAMIQEKRDINYNPKYDLTIPLNKQDVRKNTISIIALLHFNYWCINEEERNNLRKLFSDNEIKYQEETRKKYNPDNIFKVKEHKIEDIQKEENTALIEYKETIFKKIINKIKRLFKR